MHTNERGLRAWGIEKEQVLGLFGLLLIGVTWPLWVVVPWMATSPMPQIPWFRILVGIPRIVDSVALCVAILGLLGLTFSRWFPVRIRWSAICFTIGWSILLSLDQHRLQPWAWQFLILGCLISLTNFTRYNSTATVEPASLTYWQWLTISIYFYSAVSKVDASFLTSHGQLLLQGLFASIGIHTEFWAPQTLQLLAALLPVGELLVAILLLVPTTRRWGCIGSWVMHVMLLSTLGPWGLNHEPGVLIWNVFFILQNYFLFWIPPPQTPIKTAPWPSFSDRVKQGLIVTVLLTPLLESFELWDHWPSWAIYCSRPEKVEVLINRDDTELVADRLKKHLGQPALFSDNVPLNLDALSFESRFCPLYPQARYRLALALAILETSGVREESVSVVVSSTPNRLTGKREIVVLHGLSELAWECDDFWLNTQPRSSAVSN